MRPTLDQAVKELERRPDVVQVNLRRGVVIRRASGGFATEPISPSDPLVEELRQLGAVSIDRDGLLPGAIWVTLSAIGLESHGHSRGFACLFDGQVRPALVPEGSREHGLHTWTPMAGCWAYFDLR